MIRLVHVIDPSLPPSVLPALRLLIERLPADRYDQRVALLRTQLTAPAARAALQRIRAALPPGVIQNAAPGFGVLDPIGDRALRPFVLGAARTLFHAWSIDAFAVCRRRPDTPAVLTLSQFPDDTDALRRLQTALAPNAAIAAGHQFVRRRAGECGVNPAHVAIVRQPVDFKRINEARAANLRDRLSGGGTIALISGPASRTGGQRSAAWATLIMRHIHGGLRLIVPFECPERAHIRRFVAASDSPEAWLDVPLEWGWPELVSVADLFIEAPDAACPTEPLAWAMAAGLPIIASAIRPVAELIAARSNGLLCKHNTPARLAAAMLQLHDDPALARKLAETARGQAFEMFGIRDYIDNSIRLYDNLLEGRAVSDQIADTAMVA